VATPLTVIVSFHHTASKAGTVTVSALTKISSKRKINKMGNKILNFIC
jgi:hypothetical protein